MMQNMTSIAHEHKFGRLPLNKFFFGRKEAGGYNYGSLTYGSIIYLVYLIYDSIKYFIKQNSVQSSKHVFLIWNYVNTRDLFKLSTNHYPC